MENPQTPRDEQQKHILLALENGASRSKACAHARVPRRTFYNWLEADVAYKAQVEDAEREAVDTMENLAYMCAEKALHDPRYLRAMFFYLKCKAGWKETPQPTTPSVGARHAVPSSQNTAPLSQNHPAPTPQPHNHTTSQPHHPTPRHSGDGAALPATCKAQHTEIPVEVVPSVPSRPDLVGASRRLALVPGHILMKPRVPAQEAGPGYSRRTTRTGASGKPDEFVPAQGSTYPVANELKGMAWKRS